MVPLVLMLAVVVVIGVVVDFIVVVNDNTSFFFMRITTTIPCRIVFNTTLRHPSNYIPPVLLNPTNFTISDHIRSITPLTIYNTRFVLLDSSHTTLHILLYPVHLTLTHLKCKNKQKKYKREQK